MARKTDSKSESKTKIAKEKPAAKEKPVAVVKPAAKPAKEPKAASGEVITYGTGRRKDAVARVWVRRGSGKITVNGKEFEKYFARPVLRMMIHQPFAAIDRLGNFDVTATVKGGGLSGQAGAVRLGLSRALDTYDETFHTALRRGGFLTRDSRVVERKKYGHKKARRSFQFSKR